ncbi:competence protein CoiA family protein [Bombilactobacillus thymidiniphilus]|uniref:Competence protein CoiA nuclease-like domain-containing protein n=1 Tax=Bombilactobacillus thymidiniphilus TaxID=2923363 RepID=A0ABY4PCC9_9LACO|nr:competence protein CoiA family protein [Bombilactobacillus thymidiniphilus]UQS83275.1 hypothetical protein MOO47_05725 [Bombilactobacillus thymidiniphilus]
MIIILIAKNNLGQLIYAVNYQAGMPVFCPDCDRPVELIVRPQQRPYFRHKVTHRGNNETKVHQQGKNWLADFWRQQGKVRLEAVITSQQRVDVLVQMRNIQLAVEYQCSSISAQQLQRRQQLYLQQGLHGLWIFGPSHYNKASKLVHLQTIMSYTARWGFFVIFKLPQENYLRLQYHYQVHPTSNQLYYQQQKISTVQQLLNFRPVLTSKKIAMINWQNWYQYRQRRPDRQFILLQNWCYQRQINLLQTIKKTSLFAVLPIYKYLACYLTIVRQIPNAQYLVEVPLVGDNIIQQCADQESAQQFGQI